MTRRIAVVVVVAVLLVSAVGPAAAAQPEANGTVSISADPASDGSSYDYAISDSSNVSNFSVGFEGVINKNDRTINIETNSSSTDSVTMGGSIDPVNSSVTANYQSERLTESASESYDVYGSDNPSTNLASNNIETITGITLNGSIGGEAGADGDLKVFVDGVEIDRVRVDDANPNVDIDGLDIPVSGDVTVSVDLVYQDPGFNYWSWDKTQIEQVNSPTDATMEIDGGQSISLNDGETRSINLSVGPQSVDTSISGNGGSVIYQIESTERTETTDPHININGQSAGIDGTLANGETEYVTVNPEWIKNGRNNVSISTTTPANGPGSLVDLDYQHDASTTIKTEAISTQFESRYNISHNYRSATDNASIILPFDSSRIVEIATLEYRVGTGLWETLDESEYKVHNGSEVTADISAAEGGELPEDTEVDVKAVARKIEVENGAVTITEATAPGDDLDSKIRVDSKSDGFQINVGPTVSGSRVHYGLSDDFGGSGPDGSAVIEANGDQHVQFPNALAGDSVRMKHLKTQVTPKSGDVRIDVEEAGSDPKIDVSPGPGGEGDPVDIKYYRTQTGQQYILESLTQGIVLDDDVAESPAVFSDDDSEETWLIGLGSVGGDDSTESDDSGIIGPVQTNSGFEIPFGGPLPALAALLGVGLTAAVYWSGRDGFGTLRRVGLRAGSATRSSIPVIGGVLGRLVSGLLTLLSLGGSGLVKLAQFLRARPTLGTIVTVGLVLASVVSGVVPVPQGTTVAIFAVAVPLVSFVVLRRLDEFSPLVWGATSAIGLIVSLVLLGVEFGGLINEQTSLILVVGGLYLAYRAVQAYREGNITNVVIPGRRGGDGQ